MFRVCGVQERNCKEWEDIMEFREEIARSGWIVYFGCPGQRVIIMADNVNMHSFSPELMVDSHLQVENHCATPDTEV